MSDVCRREPEVVRAAADGEWTEELRAHASSCSDCAAAASVSPWISRFAAVPDREHMLPDPSVVWLKAQLLRNTAVADRATRPMTSMQIASYLIVAACWAAVLTWKWQAILQWVHRLSPGELVIGASAGSSAPMPTAFLVALAGLVSLTIAVALQTILADEA